MADNDKTSRGAFGLPTFITKDVIDMFFDYDYTFCRSEICINTECKRHRTKVPKNTPISISDFTSVCEEILVQIDEVESD